MPNDYRRSRQQKKLMPLNLRIMSRFKEGCKDGQRI
jgi:hypothetical protein